MTPAGRETQQIETLDRRWAVAAGNDVAFVAALLAGQPGERSGQLAAALHRPSQQDDPWFITQEHDSFPHRD